MLHDMVGSAAYMAHGYCLLWKPWLVALHAGSDLAIFLAYSAIPVAMLIFMSQRPNIELGSMARWFAAFILLCGLTHLINLITLWYPIYETQGVVKAATAGVSVATALLIFPMIPQALAIPSPAELQSANKRLALEIAAHKVTLSELERARAELEDRVEARTRELQEALDRFRSLFEGAPVPMLMTTAEGAIQQVNHAAEELFGYGKPELVGRQVETLLPEDLRDRHAALRESYQKQPTARRMGLNRDLYGQRKDGSRVAVEIGLNPMQIEGATFVVTSIVDISERKQRAEQVALLMREVNHRAKNMLGLVQAVARQTAASNSADFVERFSRRIRGLAAGQDLLVKSEWRGVECGELVRAQLSHFSDLLGSRVVVDGPQITLLPQAAQTIGMAVHELATNAGKYGALSNATGSIRVTWQVEPGADGRKFAMSWVESGGPPVVPPTRTGFGTQVLTTIVEANLEAEVTLDYSTDGVSWRVRCPVEKSLEQSGA